MILVIESFEITCIFQKIWNQERNKIQPICTHSLILTKSLFDLEVKGQGPTKYHWPMSKDKNVMVRTRKYYLKNNYLTLRSKVKVPQRSVQYLTHCLMVMHPHTKYHWPVSKDKNVMVRRRKYYLKTIIWPWGQRSMSHKGHYNTRHTALWSCTHITNSIDLSGKTKKVCSGQASLRRSGRRSGSGSGRRRKNQTKIICLPSFEGET
jgi:hypothetical protein